MRRAASAAAAVAAVLACLPGSAAGAGLDFGVYYNGSPEAAARGMALVKAQGSEVIRLPFRWNRIQPEQGGGYDWSEWDAQVRFAARNGIRVLANLHGTPDWAASPDPADGSPNTEAPPVPERYRDYRAYLEAAVGRYGPGGQLWRENPGLRERPIVEWEIHNEPNVARFWTDGEPDPEAYAELVLVSAAAIKAVDPAARVIAGSTAGSCAKVCPDELLETLFARPGMQAATDGVAFHAYRATPAELAAYTARVRRVVSRLDSPETPLHLTEFGWGTCSVSDPERDVCVDSAQQARLLERSLELLRAGSARTRLATAHWFIQFDLEPCREPATFFCSFGLVGVGPKGGLGPKPAWRAYRDVARR